MMNERHLALFNEMDFNPSTDVKPHLLLVDGLNTFIRAWSVVPDISDDSLHVGGISGCLKSIGYAIKQFNPTQVCIIFDGISSSDRKRKMFSGYKQNRSKNKLRVNRGIYGREEFEDDDESKKRQIYVLSELLSSLPVTVMSYEGLEADDVIGYITSDLWDHQTTIMSTDKDFIQLVNEKTSVWSPTKKKLYTPDVVLDEYGISVNNFLMYRMCDGDTSDNIPGVKGLGLSTLKKRFPILSGSVSLSIDEFIDYAKDHRGRLKVYDSILENEDVLRLNHSLMALDTSEFSGLMKLQIQKRFRENDPKLNKAEFLNILRKYKMVGSFKDPLGWLSSVFTWD